MSANLWMYFQVKWEIIAMNYGCELYTYWS